MLVNIKIMLHSLSNVNLTGLSPISEESEKNHTLVQAVKLLHLFQMKIHDFKEDHCCNSMQWPVVVKWVTLMQGYCEHAAFGGIFEATAFSEDFWTLMKRHLSWSWWI